LLKSVRRLCAHFSAGNAGNRNTEHSSRSNQPSAISTNRRGPLMAER
jgi:hypothetical protein